MRSPLPQPSSTTTPARPRTFPADRGCLAHTALREGRSRGDARARSRPEVGHTAETALGGVLGQDRPVRPSSIPPGSKVPSNSSVASTTSNLQRRWFGSSTAGGSLLFERESFVTHNLAARRRELDAPPTGVPFSGRRLGSSALIKPLLMRG